MTSGQQASVIPTINVVVTVANNGIGDYGFQSGVAGAVSPTTLKGQSFNRLQSNVSRLNVTLNAVVAQNFFLAVLIQKSDGSYERLETSAATFSVGAVTSWTWAGTPFWNAAATRAAIFYV